MVLGAGNAENSQKWNIEIFALFQYNLFYRDNVLGNALRENKPGWN